MKSVKKLEDHTDFVSAKGIQRVVLPAGRKLIGGCANVTSWDISKWCLREWRERHDSCTAEEIAKERRIYRSPFLWPIGSMYGIYANIYHQYTPFMLPYIPYMDPMGDMNGGFWPTHGSLALFVRVYGGNCTLETQKKSYPNLCWVALFILDRSM